MSKYTGRAVTINAPAQVVADKFSDLTVFQDRLDKVPDDVRAKMGKVDFERDAIVLTHPQIGKIKFSVVERRPDLVRMECTSPIHVEMTLHLESAGADATRAFAEMDVDLPAMLKPFVAPHLQKVADQFGDMLGKIAEA